MAVPQGCLDQPATRHLDDGHAGLARARLAAFGWSLYALFWGSAGEPGMTHPFELTIERMSGDGNIYFEAAAG